MRRATTKGFKRTSTLLRDRIRSAGESRGFAVTRVLTHWAEIVGQDMAGICRPVDVKYGRTGFGATLTVLTTGAQAPMLEMQKEKLRSRVNAAYGYNAITHLRITQTAATGFADGQAQFSHRKTPADAPKDPNVVREAAEVAAPVGDTELRHALARLAENVLGKNKHSKKGF
ncbi:DUF721 domain-containing protein [Shimia haliotis]|uniref:RNA-binding protein n=1 Tax=Shimia haliotis TaxID=1280847 RepID=A0A1I4GD55_9RHOB|nr:DUF721 domain-containing protein [Shimia haliotis]SFL27965.1 hypothetical protein SAMN04488036_10881 [Shimia haliotis]